MDPTDPTTAIVQLDLGDAATFDQNVFPLAYYDDGNDLNKGCLLIQATLDEMTKIKELGIDLNKNGDFIFNTRLQLEELNAAKEKLNRKTLNPFKAFRNYRAARLFHAASKALFEQTKSTSEKIHREEKRPQVVLSKQMRLINGAIPPGAKIGGVSVHLPDGWDDNAKQTINDATETIATADGPFQDNSLISQLRDDEHAITLLSQDVDGSGVNEGNRTSVASSDLQPSRPTSPQTINHFHYYQNSIVAPYSNLDTCTVNHGSRNSGASVTQELAP